MSVDSPRRIWKRHCECKKEVSELTNTLEPLTSRHAVASERSSAGAVALTEETQGVNTPALETLTLRNVTEFLGVLVEVVEDGVSADTLP